MAKFCKNCGNPLNENDKFCNSCGTVVNAEAAQPAQSTSHAQPAQGYQAPVATAPKAPSAVQIYFKKVLSYVANFFTGDPSKTMVTAVNEKTPIWYALTGGLWLLGFGAMMALIQALGNISIEGTSINEGLAQMHKIEDSIPSSFLGCVGFFRVLLFSLIVICGSYGVKAIGTWICSSKIAKINISLPTVLNLLGVAELPMVAGIVLATVLCFIWWPLGIIALLAGSIITTVSFCEAIKVTGIFGEKKIWVLGTLCVIINLVFCLLLYWAIGYWGEALADSIGFDFSDFL